MRPQHRINYETLHVQVNKSGKIRLVDEKEEGKNLGYNSSMLLMLNQVNIVFYKLLFVLTIFQNERYEFVFVENILENDTEVKIFRNL